MHTETSDTAPEGFMRVAEAASFLGMSENALRILEKQGGVPAYRLGKRVLFDRAELAAFVKRQGRGNHAGLFAQKIDSQLDGLGAE